MCWIHGTVVLFEKSIKILCDCYKYLVELPLTGFPLDESDKEKRHQYSVSTAA